MVGPWIRGILPTAAGGDGRAPLAYKALAGPETGLGRVFLVGALGYLAGTNGVDPYRVPSAILEKYPSIGP